MSNLLFFLIKNISFAKSRSEVIDKLEGRWMPKKKSKKNLDKKKGEVEEQKEPAEQPILPPPMEIIMEPVKAELNAPNNVLMLEDLPTFVTSEILQALFG